MFHRNSPESPPTRYWDLPELQIGNNSRVGSVSVHMSIIAKYGTCFGVAEPTKDVYMLVREPVARFVSSLRKFPHLSIDDLIDNPPKRDELGNHFEPQAVMATVPKRVFLYRFPDHLERFARDVGLISLSHCNPSVGAKPTLTAAQTAKVLEFYKEDVKLFRSIA